MSKEPSAWAKEKARAIFNSGPHNRLRHNDQEMYGALCDSIARAFDSALSEQAEAVRVLAEVIESREQSRMNFVAGAARSVAAMQALSNNPIARAAVEAAKGSQ